jgi:L-threonylcarbamoyladenylate synthase
VERIAVDPERPDPEVVRRAADVIRAGGLVAFPTETVYGLGADALDPAAIARIYAAKGRPSFNPLIVHVADVAGAEALAAAFPAAARRLAERFWPGPLTLVLPKRPHVPDAVSAGLPSVALRVPAHSVALALIRTAGRPIAAPSANRYTELSPTTADHVVRGLGDRVAMVLDAGPAEVGIESTVVDCTGDRPRLLRPGLLSRDELAAVAGRVDLAAAAPKGTAPRPSPGMVERHYAPRARLVLVDPAGLDAAAARAGRPAGAIVVRSPAPSVEHPVRLPDSAAGYARGLYAALHRLDELGCAEVVVERPPAGAEWAGVHDRLRRAAHPAGPARPGGPGPGD